LEGIRDKVERERTLLKKIELAIPGFRGYRKREDARNADKILRDQLADKLHHIRDEFENVRKTIANAMELELMGESGKIINLMYEIEGKIRHAEGGYSPLVSDFKIDVDEIYKIYEWDLALLDRIKSIGDKVQEAHSMAMQKNWANMMDIFMEIENELLEFRKIFDERVYAIANILVEG